MKEFEDLQDVFLQEQSKNDNEPAIPIAKAMEMIVLERKKLGL